MTTLADGKYSLTVPTSGGRGTISVTKTGYAANSKVVRDGSAITNLAIVMLPVDLSATIDPTAGATLAIPSSSAGLTLGSGVLADIHGRAVTSGNVTVELTSIDPLAAPSTMPGDFATASQSIESFGALSVQMSDSVGAEVNLGSGKSATVKIAVPAGSTSPPSSIPLFYFDKATGNWVEQGTATLVGTSPTWYYTGTVTHFSTWNADRVYDRVTIKGKVKNTEGVAVAGALVTAEGTTYTGTTTTRSDSAGAFQVYAKANSTVLVRAQKDGRTSNTATVSTLAAGSTSTTLETTPLVIGTTASITVKLTWGANPYDLDSHLTGPISGSATRFHVYFGSKGSLTASPWSALDVDDTSGYGPEVVTINKLIPGTYRYSVHHYGGSSTISASPARVEANIDGTLRVFTPPTSALANGSVWTVFEMLVASGGGVTVTPINTIAASATYNQAIPRSAGSKPALPEAVLSQF